MVLHTPLVDRFTALPRLLADHNALQLRLGYGGAEGVRQWNDVILQRWFHVIQKVMELLHALIIWLDQLLQHFIFEQFLVTHTNDEAPVGHQTGNIQQGFMGSM